MGCSIWRDGREMGLFISWLQHWLQSWFQACIFMHAFRKHLKKRKKNQMGHNFHLSPNSTWDILLRNRSHSDIVLVWNVDLKNNNNNNNTSLLLHFAFFSIVCFSTKSEHLSQMQGFMCNWRGGERKASSSPHIFVPSSCHSFLRVLPSGSRIYRTSRGWVGGRPSRRKAVKSVAKCCRDDLSGDKIPVATVARKSLVMQVFMGSEMSGLLKGFCKSSASFFSPFMAHKWW